jgi:hypothetical protein
MTTESASTLPLSFQADNGSLLDQTNPQPTGCAMNFRAASEQVTASHAQMMTDRLPEEGVCRELTTPRTCHNLGLLGAAQAPSGR